MKEIMYENQHLLQVHCILDALLVSPKLHLCTVILPSPSQQEHAKLMT